MASDAINKIKQAEEQASNLVNDAKDKSLEIQEQMKVQGNEEFEKIVSEGKNEREKILQIAEEKGVSEEAPILEKAKRESEKVLSKDQAALNSIADSIVERIVNNNGNS